MPRSKRSGFLAKSIGASNARALRRVLPTARRPLATFIVAFAVLAMLATGLLPVRGRAASVGSDWPAVISRIFANRTAPALSPPIFAAGLPLSEKFDGIGTSATASLPADFRVDKDDTKVLSQTISNGSNFYLAWNYSVTSGTASTNAQALAIDNISIQATQTISGTVYNDKGTTNIGSGKTVKLFVNGGSSTTTTTNGSGQYSFSAVSFSAGDVITVLISGATEKGATVTLAPNPVADITGLDIYQDSLILRHENAGPISNGNLNTGNPTTDGDLNAIYTVAGGTTLNVAAGKELRIPTGESYTPGGDVTTTDLFNAGTLSAGASTINIGGVFTNGGTFTKGTSNVNYNQQSDGQTVTAVDYATLTFSNFNKTLASSGTIGITNGFAPGAATGHTVTGSTIEYHLAGLTGLSTTVLPPLFKHYHNLKINEPGNTIGPSLLVVDGTLQLIQGTFTSASDYHDVVIDVGTELALALPITVSGNWTNNGTFTPGTHAVTFDGTTNQTIGLSSSNVTTFYTLNSANTGTGTSVSLGKDTTVSNALNVQAGVFDHGASFNLLTAAASVSSGATWRNLGTGDLTLSGDVSNSGTINFNANGTSCGDANDILIRSSSPGTPRTWSGTGTFSMIDVDVADQKVPLVPPPVFILVNSGTNSLGNTGWVFVDQCTAGTYTWIGGPNQDWIVPTNWSPTRVTPATGDILIFDGNSTPAPTVTNVPTETDAALRLINGVFGVTLSASGTNTLSLGGSAGPLSVPAGTLLTLSGGNALTISVNGTGPSSIGGLIIFQGGAHRLIGAIASELTFASGSIFTTSTGFTGNPFGTGTNGSVIFDSGSSAFFNAGSSPFGGSGNSVATFNPGSSQTFAASSAFSSDGRTYGHLTLTGGQSYAGTGSGQMTISNNLTIGTTSTLTLSPTAGGDLNLLGNFTDSNQNGGAGFVHNNRTVKFTGGNATQTVMKSNAAEVMYDVLIAKTAGPNSKVSLGGNTLRIDGALQFNSSDDVLELVGASLLLNGTVSGAGGIRGDLLGSGIEIGGTGALGTLRFVSGGEILHNLTVNRMSSGSVDLGSNLTLGDGSLGGLGLNNGVINTGANTLIHNAPGLARTNGYVIGNLQKNFAATGSYTFHVGTLNAYSPLGANVTGNTFPANLTVNAVEGPQPNISGANALQRYWTLTEAGDLQADLTFHYRGGAPASGDVVGNEANYKIFKYDGSFTQFTPDATGVNSPQDHFATLNGVSSFSDWTLAEPAAVLPDLVLTKTDSHDPVTVGNNLTYTLTVTNNGSGTATNVSLTDTLPANVTFVSASSGCTELTGTVTCDFGTLAGAASATKTITVVPTAAAAATTLSNAASVTSTETDVNTSDNSDTETTAVVAATCVAPPSGMVAWYPADGNANDIQGPTFENGTLQNGATFASGKVSQAFSLNGTNQYVNVASAAALPATFTLDAWVNPTNVASAPMVFSKDDGATSGHYFQIETDGKLVGSVRNTSLGFTQYRTNSPAVVSGRFQHIAMTYDGSAAADQKMTFYVDGVNYPALHLLTYDNGGTPLSGPGSARLGIFSDGTLPFAGLIDEFEQFNGVLSGAQIASIYNASSAGKCRTCTTPPTGMQAWWPAEGNANDIAGPNNGTFAANTYAPGKVGQAFSLNGTTDYVSLPNLVYGSSFTVDAWIKTNTVPTGGLGTIVDEIGASTSEGFQCQVSAEVGHVGQVRFYLSDDPNTVTTYSTALVNDNVFHHVACVKNGNTAEVYVDGVLSGTGNVSSITGVYDAVTGGTSIGAARLGAGQFFQGLIDEVEIFSRALTATEVAAIANAGNAGKCHTSTVTVAVSPSSVAEDGVPNLVYTFTRSGDITSALTANFSVGGTASFSGGDYTQTGAATFDSPSGQGTVSFLAGSGSATVTINPTVDSTDEPDETVILTVTADPGYSVGSPDSASGTITDDDQTPDINIGNLSQNEGDSSSTTLNFTVTLSNPSSGNITVDYTTAIGSTNPATAGTCGTVGADYTTVSGTVTFTAGQTSNNTTIQVPVCGDTTVEPDETFFVNLSNNSVNSSIQDGQGLGTITNDDTDVSVAVLPASSAEDTGPSLVYTFTRTGVTAGLLTVNFSVGGTASFPSDYAQTGAASFSSSSGTVTIGAGNPSATVTIDPTTDISYEPSETVILTVTSGTGYNVGSPSAATGTITDEDAIPTALVVTKTADTNDGFCSLDDCSLREAISNANVISDTNTITFAIPAATDAGCNSLTGVCTIKPSPALPAVSTPVNINGYTQTGASANTLAVGSDAALKIELDGTNAGPTAIGLEFAATQSSVRGLVINRFGQDGIRLTLNTNNVIAGNFIGTDVTGTSAAGNGLHGVFLNGTSGITVGGTTEADRNVISGGTTSGSQGIQIAGPPSTGNVVKGNYIGTNAAGTAAIPNGGDGVKIIGSSNTVIGGATALERNVIAGNGLDGIRVNGAGTIIKGNFIGTNSAGAVLGNGQAGVQIVGANNNVIGGTTAGEANTVANNGIKGVFVQSGTGNAIRGNSIHSNTGLGIDLGTDGVTPNDDDDPDTGANDLQNFPIIRTALVGTPNTIRGTLNSTGGGATFTIDLYSSPTCNAVAPNDYGEGKTYLGSTTSTATNGAGDALWSYNPASLTSGHFVTATATDSAGNTSEFSKCLEARAFTAGTIAFSQANTDNTETNSSTHTVDITVTRTGGSDGAVSVQYDVTNGSATTADSDYSVSPASGTFNWANGNSASKTITITVNGDTKFELDETVNLTLSNATGGATIGTNPATLTIKNDDTPPTISINEVPQNEGNGPGTTNIAFTVSLSNASYLPITVDYTTAIGTTNPATVGTCGTAGVDYQTVSGTVSFAPGQTSNNTTIQVPVCGDTTFESNETFFVNLSNVNANATILDNQGLGTITNDDPLPTISIDNVTHNEGNVSGVDNDPDLTNYNFTVTLANPSDQTITVDYATANDSATAPSDYTAITTTTLTFNPGETSKPVTVVVKGDTIYELNERFFVNLSNVNVNATILDGQGDGTITNDDAAPTLSINDRSNNEGTMPVPLPSPTPLQNTTMTFTVTKTGSTAVTATVIFATAPGSATGSTAPCPSGSDYQTQTGSLSFLANETTKTITVPICKDPDFEANETFFVNLSAPTHATFTDAQGQGTILNDDIPSGGFTVTTTDDLDDTVCDPVGHCSLREAIIATNNSSTVLAIKFGIPADDHFNLAGPRHFYYANDGVAGQVTLANVRPTTTSDDSTLVGAAIDPSDPDWPHSWWSILPTSQLPSTTRQVFVDGNSQPGTAFNTLTTGTNARLRIELNGASAGLNATGLTISGGTSTVRGLAINRFQRDGSAPTPTGNGLSLPSGNNTVSGNFLGTDVSGTLDVGSLAGLVTGSGISTTSFNNVIGGVTPAVINLMAGNDRDGISFSNSNTNVIRGNLIGTKANGASALGNGASGISFTGLGSVANTVGGPDAGEGNTIAFNSLDGISLSNANFGNSIRGNSIFSNGTTNLHLGIDLGADGVTDNDDLDGDTGPNNLQNFPIITAAMVTGSTRTIKGTLNSSAGDTFIIDFYQSPACVPACGIGEGKTYLGSTSVTTDVTTGYVAFTFHPLVLTTSPAPQFVTATATSTGASGFDTSEFSARTIIADGSLGGAAGDIVFRSATYTVGEAGVTASITVGRDGGSNGSVTANFSTVTGGTATADSDYTARTDVPITYVEGETADKTVTVFIADDGVFESNETVFLSLGDTGINATRSKEELQAQAAQHSAVLTITDNDTAPSFAINDVTIAEGDSGTTSFVFTVTKTGSTEVNATVNFATSSDSALSGSDFATNSGTLTFVPSDSSEQITVLVTGELTVEPNERFFVNLTNPTNATISDGIGQGTITNDDTDVTVAVSPSAVAEDGTQNLVYTFTRTGVTGGALTVNFSVSGTASSSTDYALSGAASFVAPNGTVTFGAGNSTAAVTIDPATDLTFEPDETVILTVTSGTSGNVYNVASPSSATGTITNDDAAGGIVKFSAANYDTTENSHSVTITVERVGDTTAAVSVDYATPDDSAATTVVPCADVTGLASPRCDFTTALGTLRFAVGETSKTFTVLISQDRYLEGPEALILTLSNLTGGAVFGVPSTATITIADDATEPATNPIDDADNFVRQHYHDFLNREPDADGLAFWTNEITQCGTDAQCIESKRINVSAAFYLSIEFQNTGYLVERLYKGSYGDATGTSTIGGAHQLPVPIVQFSEFLSDTQTIGQGVVVGQTGWETVLENNKQAFVAEFVQRSRFTTAYANTLTPEGFVDLLFTNAGVTPTPTERQAAIDEFGGAGTSANAAARGRALRRVAENSTLAQQEFNRAFVLMQYFGYLRRNPNAAPDSDHSGYDFWLTKLNNFTQPGDDVLVRVQKAEMVKAFIVSGEYRQRFGP